MSAKTGLLACAVAVAAVAAVWEFWESSEPAASTASAALAAEFCNTAPPEAQVDASAPRAREFAAEVPRDTPPVGMPFGAAYSIVKGDVVEFAVSSPRAGALAVHGLFDPRPVAPGDVVKVAFRAIYTGRFPLHFHGDDGSHFEIAALEVRSGAAAPAPASAIGSGAAAGRHGQGGQS